MGKNKGGRPSGYSEKIADEICSRMIHGETLRAICRDEHMPVRYTVFRWLDKYPEFRDHYARAREALQDYWADEIVEIADDASNDYMTIQRGEESVQVENKEVVNRSRLRIDSRKWLMSKLNPKKYGDKIEQTIKGEDGPAVLQIVQKETKS